LGYASAAFRNHATGFLLRHMFGHHDRDRFEVIGYHLRPGDGGACRADIEAAMDRFVDVSALSDVEAADRIHGDGIDILIDIDGYTNCNRAGMFALRPARVQAGWLGFPGTTGADYLDYIIADAVVTPPGTDSHYSEAVVRLPNCYQANDHRHMKLKTGLRRADHGLPDDAVVFCCFNVARKIDQATFGRWMAILRRVEGSVLWLLPDSDAVLATLRDEAAGHGIEPARLIAAPRTDPLTHVSRGALADLFLDTFICNAHTTASDALWSGLPVLTCPGETFASRVAASIVSAAGLDELVCDSPDAYEDTAVALAHDPDRLAALRQRLMETRETCPLFDTAALVRDLEAAFTEMIA
jgi:predicted O-linked N-acetylglucosamine transferase (SPINDLY family)